MRRRRGKGEVKGKGFGALLEEFGELGGGDERPSLQRLIT